MAAADVLVFISRHEGSARVVAEAMAMALPVLASDVGGIRDMVNPDETGLLLQLNSAEETNEAVGRLIDDPALRRRLGDRALEVAKREWPFEKRADLLVRLHLETLRSHIV
jgi:glycosyltransferase involved in cell wall biosynthesis